MRAVQMRALRWKAGEQVVEVVDWVSGIRCGQSEVVSPKIEEIAR
jgi:hypothetical protein